MQPGVNVSISEGIATITFNRPKSLNAITQKDYDDFAEALWAIDKRDDVVISDFFGTRYYILATGRMFCSGTDVSSASSVDPAAEKTVRSTFLDRVARSNSDPTRALYSHRKLLVAAVHGPVFGIAAAYLGHFDFIYCLPEAYLSVPFTFIGIISEAGSSVTFARRMGIAKANEILLFGKKMTAQEMLDCGFANKIFPSEPVEAFHATIRAHVKSELANLEPSAVLRVKELMKIGFTEVNNLDAVNMRESYAQAERLSGGVAIERFAKIARKEIRHKL